MPSLVRTRGAQLGLLTLAASSGMYARTALGPLQESMRIALTLTDNQMALLQGVALALPLSVAAAPLGVCVDRYSRARLLQSATLLAIAGTLATALAHSFITVFLARCIVGLAAPATAVASFSLLADLYPPEQRGRAAMIVVLGQSAGSSGAFALGGQLLVAAGANPNAWRWALFAMAGALIPMVASLWLLREPQKTGATRVRYSLRELRPMLKVYAPLLAILLGAMCLVNLADGAALIWAATSLMRKFGLAPNRVGAIMAAVLLAGGVAGPLLGGFLADVCQKTAGPRLTITALSGLAAVSIVTSFFSLAPKVAWASVLLIAFITLGTAISVMTTAVSLIVIPNELRGLCVSVKFALAMLFGLGLAPLTVSLLSARLGDPSTIGAALSYVCAATSLLGAATFAYGQRHFPRSPR